MDSLNHVFSHSKVNCEKVRRHQNKQINLTFCSQIDSTTLQLVYQLQLLVKEFNELINKLLVDLLATHRTMCKLSSVLFAVFATIFSKVGDLYIIIY